MIDYLTIDYNVYIKSIDDKNFDCYDYKNEKLMIFHVINETYDKILFNFEFIKGEQFLLEGINLFSEMLYFKGNKVKDIFLVNSINSISLFEIGFSCDNEYYKKSIDFFEEERKNKVLSLNELYESPYLVPWNLVNREWDVIELIKQNLNKNDSILEIGSGYGKNLLLLNEIGFENVKGLEYSKKAWELSQNFNYNKKNNVYGDITKTEFNDLSFNAIIDIGCLHCIPDNIKPLAIDEIYRILKDDGMIISRYFLPKNKEWLKNYPVKVDKFGNTFNEIKQLMQKYFILENSFIEDNCIYIVGRKKHE